jgi:hypothetical protein
MDRIETSSGVYLIGSAPVTTVRLNLSARLINHDTVFFSYNESASTGLSAAKTISRTAVPLVLKAISQLIDL